MSIPVEIMLRGDERVYSEQVAQPLGDPSSWGEREVSELLRAILLAIDRVQNPDRTGEPPVGFRGVNWIVSRYRDGVVVAVEIHSASAVAGPVPADLARLEDLLARVIRAEQPSPVVH